MKVEDDKIKEVDDFESDVLLKRGRGRLRKLLIVFNE